MQVLLNASCPPGHSTELFCLCSVVRCHFTTNETVNHNFGEIAAKIAAAVHALCGRIHKRGGRTSGAALQRRPELLQRCGGSRPGSAHQLARLACRSHCLVVVLHLHGSQ